MGRSGLRYIRFNLIIEILIIDSGVCLPLLNRGLQGFNLIIEILIIDRMSRPRSLLAWLGFNLIIEILIIDSRFLEFTHDAILYVSIS